jgi:L,D-transpeptidase catalytic domain
VTLAVSLLLGVVPGNAVATTTTALNLANGDSPLTQALAAGQSEIATTGRLVSNASESDKHAERSFASRTADGTDFSATLLSIKPGEWLPLYRSASSKTPVEDSRSRYYATGRYWILARRGDWVGVSTIAVHTNRLAWVNVVEHASRVRYVTTTRRVLVDRSARTLRVELDGKTVFSTRVAVGRPSAPTPLGQTSVEAIVTPRQAGVSPSYYGPWIFQLGLYQRHSSPGFPQGGATAFHGTPNPDDIGKAVSAGCIRLTHGQLRRLHRYVTVGTPVIVSA